MNWLLFKATKVFNHRLDFQNKKKIETTDTLAIIQGQKLVETTVRFSK